ncbi:hypothetical protein A2634_01665 [Candidatus Amesbacteria bacterium RIFCSPHIGHO2_01_FULL_48_32]|uniref:Uncharacterized protein n=1 Tax=Candidatus Amesbacteria bacterium RIFCSPLOWO2_01_FULL_48_25 TaxID=1797259 RepID=A0A1F4ZBJ8_9BACT|nr:MAG: hypothetical protein A2634_01665 [Candidatus Amesbacteria bacterium RIFCSPHIGHO2_01_FULL_48_32]OGD03749.1 MAG: hypothetical protein A2989_03650 [Candidatus Amesbacteria bacterium RIFCSPLOWO2_01_FULL_48_25]
MYPYYRALYIAAKNLSISTSPYLNRKIPLGISHSIVNITRPTPVVPDSIYLLNLTPSSEIELLEEGASLL